MQDDGTKNDENEYGVNTPLRGRRTTYTTRFITKISSKTMFLEHYSFHDVIVMSPHYKSNSGASAITVLTDFIVKILKMFYVVLFMPFIPQKQCFCSSYDVIMTSPQYRFNSDVNAIIVLTIHLKKC